MSIGFPKLVSSQSDKAEETSDEIRRKIAHLKAMLKCATKAERRRKTMKPRQECPICGKPAPIPQQRCCSAACAYRWRKLQKRPERTCPVCGIKYFPIGNERLKFCSRKCYDSVRTAEAFETVTCAQCGKQRRRRRVRTRPYKHKFCGRRCAWLYNRGEQNPLWRGEKDPNRGGEWRRLAERIRERDGRCCQLCGKTEADNGKRLSVDHIRPWRSFSTESKVEANNPANLISLCTSCHSKKTADVEQKWLRGDVLAMRQYEKSVKLPPLFSRV